MKQTMWGRYGTSVLRMVAAVGLVIANIANANTPTQIGEFVPQGRVSGVESVQLRFTTSAIAFGEPKAFEPVHLECEGPVPAGEGRWLDDRRWIYSFEQTVPAGVGCVARPNPDFRDLDGQPLPANVRYEFNTGAPAIVEFRPYTGVDIDEEQVFILRFNAPVSAQAVAQNSHCVVQGLGERIPVREVPLRHRDALMNAAYMVPPDNPDTVALLQCSRVLPPDTAVRLEVGPDISAVGQPANVAGTDSAHVLEYKVRPAFIAKLACTRERAAHPCLPITPISVLFTVPVSRDALQGVSLRAGDVEFAAQHDDDDSGFVSSVSFPGPFPPSVTLSLTLPDGLRDDAGRPLLNAERYPLEVPLADYPPLAKFASGSFGIIERFAYVPPTEAAPQEAAVPVTVRHIESGAKMLAFGPSTGQVIQLRAVDDGEVLQWYARLERLDAGSWSEAQLADILSGKVPREDYGTDVPRRDVRSISLLAAESRAQRLTLPGGSSETQRPFEVVGVPLGEPGFHILEIESPRLGASLLEEAKPMYVRTGVLLTNLSLHVKQGRDDLLVWVTTLSDARSVPDAEITVLDCSGRPVAHGRTGNQGVWHSVKPLDAPDYCADTGLQGLFVSARIPADHPQAYGAADYAFVLSEWDRGIETWRFGVPTSSGTEPSLLTHTVFDRTLFRAGERISMKHFIREETREGMQIPRSGRPDRLIIEHEGGSQTHDMGVQWQETATGGLVALNEFLLPEASHLGLYTVRLTDKALNWYGSARFRVEEFRLPLLTGKLAVQGIERPDLLVDPDRMDIDMQLSWLSGGPAGGQRVTLSALAMDRPVNIAAFEDYSFQPPPRREEMEDGNPSGAYGQENADTRQYVFLDSREFQLDANGFASIALESVPRVDRPQRFQVEAGFADPNGEVQTLSSSIDIWPSAVQVGIKAEGWGRAGRDIPVSLVAVGTDAKPRAGVAMRVEAVERKTLTVRKRMVGGFYRYDSRSERRDLGTLCEGVTDSAGTLTCTVQLQQEGSFELVAVGEDNDGRTSRAYTTVWLSGASELWFSGEDDDRIDVIPLKREWSAGEEAEFQVRMPFREAVALVSVEREGVLWTDQVNLKGNNPVIKIPVSASWGPNVYVSVLVLRGRLYEQPWTSFPENPDEQLITGSIDLAKPAFRFGLSEIRIASEADRLNVVVTPASDVLQVGKAAAARVRVTLPDGQPASFGTVAFAAIDEALLELAPNDSWSLYDAMHPRRSLSVRTATSQMEVVGRRHYGRKAVAAGGGGGAVPTRQLFNTLLSWQPLVQLDANGEAEISFRMNDSLSRFRLVAVADYARDLFGTGMATIVTRQDLQLVPGLPPTVREHDQYAASVTVRNGTQQDRIVVVNATRKVGGEDVSLPTRTLRLSPGEAGSASWDVVVPVLPWPDESGEAEWRFQAGDGIIADSVAVTQRIVPLIPTRTVQATLLDLEAGDSREVPVAPPNAALRDSAGLTYGGVAIDVSASLLGGLQGVRDWWQAYPYTCLEQTASQALALNDPGRWKQVVSRLTTQMDDDGLLRYFPGSGQGSAVLTAYLVSAVDEVARVGPSFELPDESLSRMLAGLQAFAEGRIKRDAYLSATSLDARRMAALEALSRHGRVTAAMLTNFVQKPSEWSTPTLVNWLSILMRLPPTQELTRNITQSRSVLVSRMSVSGAVMSFGSAPMNTAPELMETEVTSLARLMLAVMEQPEWQDDLPRMARGLFEGQVQGAWRITTENLLAPLALLRFAERFEMVKAEGTVTGLWALANSRATTTPDLMLNIPSKGETLVGHVDWPAQNGEFRLLHEGTGRAWIGVRAQARVASDHPEESGYRVVRRVSPIDRQRPNAWSRGDIYRVELEIYARHASSWVVLNDPIPSGATILGSGLGRDARAHVPSENADGYYAPAFVERSATGYRAYFDYLPAGKVQLSYTARLNAIGHFAIPPTRVEALYQPDLYGTLPNRGVIEVGTGVLDVVDETLETTNDPRP